MTWSMNETEALARKAARGRGMSWGLAEETGKATRHLLEAGIAASGPLADLLERTDGADHDAIRPMQTGPVWMARPGPLCPITAGASLGDHARLLQDGQSIRLERIAFPVFLIPFAQSAARQTGGAVALVWQGVTVRVSADGIDLSGTPDALLVPMADAVSCQASPGTVTNNTPRTNRASVAPGVAARLNRLAQRTYAPATEASRIAGAGAGLTDND